MKIIISHDVDHLTAWEHAADLVIPKFVVRGLIETALGTIGGRDLIARLLTLRNNKWQNIEELMAFDREHGVPSTFFVAVNKGCGLAYERKAAAYWIRRIRDAGFDVGVHGIEYDSLQGISREYEDFKSISGLNRFGIRMHYLRLSGKTLSYLQRKGYVFDSSVQKVGHPYKIENMWEFPITIMDSSLFCQGSKWINTTLEKAKKTTMHLIEHANKLDISYITINLHDVYFSPSFPQIYNWYRWLIRYAQETRMEFVSFMNVVAT